MSDDVDSATTELVDAITNLEPDAGAAYAGVAIGLA